MKKLCIDCPEKNYCEEPCLEAVAFEQENQRENYQEAGDYKPRGNMSTWTSNHIERGSHRVELND